MKGQVQSIFCAVLIAAFLATLVPLSAPAAQVRQCSAAVPKSAKGHWSWRMIDGRKCWYSGKAVIPRSALRWPAAAPAPVQAKAVAAPTITVSVAAEKRSDPLEARAQMTDDSDSFESRWQARVVSR
jgi:hypothetical protein